MPDDRPPGLQDPSPALLGVDRSVTGRRWVLAEVDDQHVSRISREQRIPDILARLLAARGIVPEEAGQFLEPRLRDAFPDPSSFADMDKAAGLVWDAIEAGRQIAVFADYDVDGATSSAQLTRWLRAIGRDCLLYVPDRVEEGYGPSAEAFAELQERGAELVITVDCGAAAHEALNAAADMALDIVVLDHHLMSDDMPPAAALVNPNRPDDQSGCGHLAAAGVTFIFLAALNREGKRRGALDNETAPNLFDWIDLAALGTICDVVPLTGVNRAIVTQGLKVMSGWHHAGLAALARLAGIEGSATTYHAGFVIGPRINAGGRIGQADTGARLMATDDVDLAEALAKELDACNTRRRDMEAAVLEAASAQAAQDSEARSVLIAAGDDWHPGVIGIVAGRLKEEFNKPAIVIGIDRSTSPAIGKGSGRSVAGVNLGGAISAAKAAGWLTSGGGHAMAGGLTVDAEQIQGLIAFLEARIAPELADAAQSVNERRVDAMIGAGGLDIDLVDTLARAAPFGQGNPEPRVAMADMRLTYAARVGKDHVRASFRSLSGETVNTITFRCADQPLGEALLGGTDHLWHIVGRAKADEWQGRRRVQLQVEDIAAAKG